MADNRNPDKLDSILGLPRWLWSTAGTVDDIYGRVRVLFFGAVAVGGFSIVVGWLLMAVLGPWGLLIILFGTSAFLYGVVGVIRTRQVQRSKQAEPPQEESSVPAPESPPPRASYKLELEGRIYEATVNDPKKELSFDQLQALLDVPIELLRPAAEALAGSRDDVTVSGDKVVVGEIHQALPAVAQEASGTAGESLDTEEPRPNKSDMSTDNLRAQLNETSIRALEWVGGEAQKKMYMAQTVADGYRFEIDVVNRFSQEFGAHIVWLLDECQTKGLDMSELHEALKQTTGIQAIRALALRLGALARRLPESEESVDIAPEPSAEPKTGRWLSISKEKTDETWTRHRQVGEHIELSIRNMPAFKPIFENLTCAVETPEDSVSEAKVQATSTSSATVDYPFPESPALADGDYVVRWLKHSVLLFAPTVIGRDVFAVKGGQLAR